MRRLVFAAVMLVLAGFALFGQTTAQQSFVVSYIDGSVQVQLKGQTAWKTLKVRGQVPADATVKLAKGAMLELVRDTTTISLIKDGIYPMASLIAKIQTSGPGLGSTVSQKIRAVSSKPLQTATAGGVRNTDATARQDWRSGGYSYEQMLADERVKDESIAKKEAPKEGFAIDNLQFFYWGIKGGYADTENPRMYEEYKDAVDQGIRALLESKYDKAIEHLRNAVTQAIFPEEERRSNYLLAVAYVEAGSPVRAWQIISKLTIGKDDLEYGDFLLRKAQLQVDSLLYDDALVTLKPLLEPLARDVYGQAACLVAWYAYKGLNRSKEAADVKQKGLSIVFTSTDASGSTVKMETETARLLSTLE